MVTRGSGASFDSGFASYGEDENNLRAEIQQDLKREILTALGSRPFARSDGFGIERLENDIIDEETEVIIGFMAASAIGQYNSKVSPERQVITSQDLIQFERIRGEFIMKLYYYLASDIQAGNVDIQVLNLSPGT